MPYIPKRGLPLAAMEKLLKKAGADRVGEDAKAALAEVLTEYAMQISQAAVRFASHAGRKTVNGNDVRLAKK